MSHNPYSAPRTSIKSKDSLPWHRRVVSGLIALPGFISLFQMIAYIANIDSPMVERLSGGLPFAVISVASFSAYFMLRKFHRYAWIPQILVAFAFGVDCIYFPHDLASDNEIVIGFMTFITVCTAYSFLTRNAKPRAEYSE